MKEPKIANPYEGLLDPFIIAADTDLDSACDLLFIHGNDLAWSRNERGLFLANVETDDNFEEVVQIVEARLKINLTSLFSSFFRQLVPGIINVTANAASELDEHSSDEDRERVTNSAILQFARKENLSQFDKMFSDIFGNEQWLLLADAITSSLVRQADALRRRHLTATGMPEDQYDSMLYALRRLGLCEQIVRVAYPKDGFDFETSLSSKGGFKATAVFEGNGLIEIYRLIPQIARLKSRQDDALAMFISNYINKNHGLRRAFSCARYGEQNEPELDVVVPALNRGFEVKLYQAPVSQAPNKLQSKAGELEGQLPAYFDRGCEKVYYVTNLSQDDGEAVLQMVHDDLRGKVELVAGIGSLTQVLNDIGLELRYFEENVLSKRVQNQISAKKKGGSRKSRK